LDDRVLPGVLESSAGTVEIDANSGGNQAHLAMGSKTVFKKSATCDARCIKVQCRARFCVIPLRRIAELTTAAHKVAPDLCVGERHLALSLKAFIEIDVPRDFHINSD
jgi:hypothetical protein